MGRFSFTASAAAKASVIEVTGIRLTVLTPCLLRLETGCFTDFPTQTVWNRDLDHPNFTTEHDGQFLHVKTEEVNFCVNTAAGVMHSITFSDGQVITDFEKGNLLGTARTLDMVNGSTRLEKGILSSSGVAVMDDSKSLLLNQDGTILPRERCSDLYYFAYGHDYRRCLKDFFRLTGEVPLIPKYVLGNWWSRYRAYTQDEYQQLMQTFIDRNIPITVATIDMDWHWTDVIERFGEDARPGKSVSKQDAFYNRFMPGWTGYSWNTELFPDHKKLLSWLHANGFHVTLNVHPSQGIRFFEDCYAGMCAALGLDPQQKSQIRFNVADTAFMEAYFDQAHHPMEEEGVDFWWLDWQQGTNSDIPGLDPLWALNHYHTLDNGRSEKRPMILSRYAGLGSHRYPLGFSGDTFCTWKSLDFQPYFTNTAANAGYTWWSHDIGGHQQGIQDDELYLRWLQYGVFSPINRLHSTNSDFMGKEPWKRSYAVQTVSEAFLRLRHKLIPYLYAANYQTHTEGTPICMPMYYVYDCKEAYQTRNQYIFGGHLLVCPITRPADKRLNLAHARLWLPEGRWTDIFNGRIYQGGQWVTMYRDLDSIPVLAPQGAIVPMYLDAKTNDLSLGQPLEIHVWRGNGSFDLYEDDGETPGCKAGHCSVTTLAVEEHAGLIRFTVSAPMGDATLLPENRQIYIRFRDVLSADVTVNGENVYSEDSQNVRICVIPKGRPVVVELRNFTAARNIPKNEHTVNLLTRVQGSNLWKNKRFSAARNPSKSKKLPEFIQNMLDELDALAY